MLRLVGPICRQPRQIREQIGASEWRSDARATPVRQVGRFRKICDRFTDFRLSGPILRTKTQPAKELAQNKFNYQLTTNYLSPIILFSTTFCKKVLTIKNACAVLALYINRFAPRLIVADRSGR